MKNSDHLDNYFWFPDDKSRAFSGSISDDEKKITALASLLGRSSKIDSIAKKYNEKFTFDFKYVFCNEHFPSSDIRFNGLIINFTNINLWINPSDIIFGKDKSTRNEITIDIDDEYSLRFFHGTQITSDEKLASNRTEKNVYVRIDSKTAQRNFEELLEKKNFVQDFLNFVVTGKSVLSKSIYGIIEGSNGEKLIEIKYKSLSTESLSKCKVISPVLFHSVQFGEERLGQITKNWFKFRKSYTTIYNYYVDSMYRVGEAIELSYFKLAAFLEGYHRELLEKNGRSEMRILKNKHFDSIERMLKETEIDGDIKIIKFVLGKNKDLMLAQRLREIFESYREIISICGPVLSFFDNNKLHKWIEKTCNDENIKKN